MEALPLILFISVFVLILIGFPVAYTLGGVALVFGLIAFDVDFFYLLSSRVYGTMQSYILIAVPMFIFMGVMLERSGMAVKLLEAMGYIFGRVKGGLAISVVVVGTLLAASTGIVGATVVTMGLLSLPTMLKKGYSAEMATGVIASSGTLGQIIPPSIVLVLLGSVLNVSVGDLFAAAVLPGVLLVGMYIGFIVLVAFIKPKMAPSMSDKDLKEYKGEVTTRKIRFLIWNFQIDALLYKIIGALVLPLSLIISVLGSIIAGIASPTEAAAIGAFGASLLTFLQGKLSFSVLKEVMKQTVFITSMVFMILAGASAFGLVFRGLHGDSYIISLIEKSNLSPYEFLALVMVIVFIAGFFIDFIEITFIIVPVVAPVFQQQGIDLVWLGILLALNLQTSFLTPPFGFALFYLKGVAPPSVTTGHLYRGILPFVGIQLLLVGLVIFFPETVSWLPSLMSGE